MGEKLYFAKSNGETIQEHTDKLLEKLKTFKNLYPNVLNTKILLYLLEKACLYHDIGKVNSSFQAIIRGKKIYTVNIPHGFLSIAYINIKKTLEEIEEILSQKNEVENNQKRFGGVIDSKSYLNILVNAIAYHHEREIKIELEDVEKEVENLKNIKDFQYEKIIIPEKLKLPNERYFSLDKKLIAKDNENKFEIVLFNYILIKGLLNKIDYCASSEIDIEIEIKNNFLEESLKNLLNEWKKIDNRVCWNELQKFMLEHRNENVISIAQTGMGKTEAGLLWIGNNKGFFVLPIRSAINAIYKRIIKGIVEEEDIKKVGLLHSETYEKYIENYEEEGESLNKYYLETKQLSLPITVCTLDQLFDFVYMYGGSEVKLATLSYSKIVLDEIQMYSWDLVSYIINGLKSITRLGGKFAILTATFPPFIEDLLNESGIKFKKSVAYVKKELRLRHSMKVIENKINIKEIEELYNKNKVLIICNTIKEAQRIYDELKNKISEEELNLFHSKFIRKDRNEKEKEILEIGEKKSKKYGIWITTQVVEASLDIDFDLLFTELSDLNGLFQRMGRCYRNREYDNKYEYNCFVYIERENRLCTGVGTVIDKEIFNLSKRVLKKEFLNKDLGEKLKSKIYEEEKMKYVEKLYSTENLKNTEYYQKLRNSLNYISYLSPFEIDKAEAKQKFRNIIAFPIIPKNIYDENKVFIDKNLMEINDIQEKLNLELPKNEKIKLRIELRKKKNIIKDFSLNLEDKYFRNIKRIEEIKLDKYQTIAVCECDYSRKYGLKAIQKLEKWDSDNII